jgi:diguanylate cyclase (GGDEF)-like protein/PAS domain S-box-containing protein
MTDDQHKSKSELISELAELRYELKSLKTDLTTYRFENNRLRKIYDLAPVMLQSLDQNHKIFHINQCWLSTLGYQHREVLGRPLEDFCTEASRENLQKTLNNNLLTKGKVKNIKLELLTKQGEVRHVLLSAIPYQAENGVDTDILHVMLDVTESVELVEKLKNFRHILDFSPDAILLADFDTLGLRDVNRTACRMLGYTKKELLQKSPGEVAVGWTNQTVSQKLKDVMNKKASAETLETTYRKKNGDTIPVELRLSAVKTEGGVVFAIIARDISRRKKNEAELLRHQQHLEQMVKNRTQELEKTNQNLKKRIAEHQAITKALKESEKRYQAFVEHVPAMVYASHLGTPGAKIYTSPQVPNFVGLTQDEFDRDLEMWTRLIHPEDVDEVMKKTRAAFSNLEPLSIVYRINHPDGRILWVRDEAVIMKSELGVPDYVLGVMFDITDLKKAEARAELLARFPDENPNPVLRVSNKGKLQYANQAGREFLEEMGADEEDMLPPLLIEAIFDTDNKNDPEESDFSLNGRDFNLHISPLSDSDSLYVYIRDTTQIHRFLRQQRLSSKVFDSSIEGIVVANSSGKVEMVNPAFSRITGYTPEEVLARDLDILRAETHQHDFFETVWQQLVETGQWSGEYMNRRKNGEAYPEWLTINLIKNSTGKVINYIAIFHDISDIKRTQEKIKHQAYHDALTGLPNRYLFRDRLTQALRHAKRNNLKVGVLFLDLDNFKHVNDSLGHDQGDILLKEVAKRLKNCVREEDTVSRLGGDEFTMILNGVLGHDSAANVARKIMDALAEPFTLSGHLLHVNASIGITLYPNDGEDTDTLTKNADMAMYRAKDRGKNNYQLFTPAMNQAAMHRLTMEYQIRQGLENKEFLLHFQPRMDLSRNKVVSAEALVRWQRQESRLTMPGDFIPVAEESGLILPLGEWIFKKAIRQALLWQKEGLKGLKVSVNISSRQFQQNGLADMIAKTIAETGFDPRLLELEITETTMMVDLDRAQRVMEDLGRMGVGFSVDDFGMGYSSLFYLKNLPIDCLKIDKSFIRDLSTDPNDAAIVDAIISMCQTLKIQSVAEGVETKEQAEYLKKRGCDQIQGYLLGRPMPYFDLKKRITSGQSPF